MTTKSLFRGLLSAAFVAGSALLMWTCKYPSGPLNANATPHTRLANVPANDTIAKYIENATFPELSLYWVGDDPDGYVIAFQYRWSTTRPGVPYPAPDPWTTALNITKSGWDNVIVVKGNPSSLFNVYNFLATLGPADTGLIRIIGDSLATERSFLVPYKTGFVSTDSVAGAPQLLLQTPTSGTFIFDSPADSNVHRFEVRAVDNSNGIDPAPATVTFWTLVSPGSLVSFDPAGFPANGSLCIRAITDRWPGLRFAYHSLDANNQFGFQFQWSVDDTIHWSDWSEDGEAFVTASDLKPIQSGAHVFYVRGRNRWGVLSPDSTHTFVVSVPPFDAPGYPQRTLILNDDRYYTSPGRGLPTLGGIDSLYSEVMDSLGRTGRFDIWRIVRTTSPSVTYGWPSRDTLGYYSSVLFLMEDKIPPIGAGSQHKFSVTDQGHFEEYLNVGGKLIFCGAPYITIGIANYTTASPTAPPWSEYIFHLIPIQPSPGLDFNGVTGVAGYPDVPLDTTMVGADSVTADVNIGSIYVSVPLGFATYISAYRSRYHTPLQGLPVGIRLLAPAPVPPARQTFSVVHFGMPLCYSPKTVIIQSLRKAFADINE